MIKESKMYAKVETSIADKAKIGFAAVFCSITTISSTVLMFAVAGTAA